MSSPRRFDASLRASRGVPRLVGVDEAGRGPMAGPLVVAAVRLGPRVPGALHGARDSKLLSAPRREALCRAIRERAEAVAVAWAHPREIDELNVLAATLRAMGRAARRAWAGAEGGFLVVVDGNRRIPALEAEQLTVVDGDRLSLAVACASIVAKVTRDRWMTRLDRRYPGYGFAEHKGYCTPEHRRRLAALGPSPVHRRNWSPVAQLALELEREPAL